MTHARPISSPRLLFGRGCRGGIVRSIQERLRAGGYSTGIIDGIYGGGTERGVPECQRRTRLPTTGSIDDTTWSALMSETIPVEQCRRDDQVTVGGVAVRYIADVAVDAPDFLDHDQSAARLVGRFSTIS